MKDSRVEQGLKMSVNQPNYEAQWRETIGAFFNDYDHFDRADKSNSTAQRNLQRNLPAGDALVTPKPANTTRLFFQNVNGLQLDQKGGKLREISVQMNEMEVDYVGVSEPNINTRSSTVRELCHQTLKDTTDRYKMVLGSSAIQSEGNTNREE
jgi:hypothetical protein